MNIVLAGSTGSSLLTLEKLIEHDLAPVAVFGLQLPDVSKISAYADLEPTAHKANIPFYPFKRINDHSKEISDYQPDVIFIVGLSQLVNKEIIDAASKGCVGFHPTRLPLGRGRAPVAWIVLDSCPAAATYFCISEGVDDGPILCQQPFDVEESDDAGTVSEKLLEACDRVLDVWLPELKRGVFEGKEQDHSKATYYAGRIDEDGRVLWAHTSAEINLLIRATTKPHPGAFTYCKKIQIRIWKSEIVSLPITAVPGTIVQCNVDTSFVVQTGDGNILVQEYDALEEWKPSVGMRLGNFHDLLPG